MREPFAELDANALDEQIDRALALSPQQAGDVDTQCLQDLQYIYRKEQILTRAAQRLDLVQAAHSGEDSHGRTGSLSVLPGMFAREMGETAPLPLKGRTKARVFAPFASYVRVKRSVLVSLSAALTLLVIAAFALLSVSAFSQKTPTSVGAQPRTGQATSSTPTSTGVLTPTVVLTAIATPQRASATPTIANGNKSLPWPFGQSTYWANQRYHQLTGYWVQWTGNADEWVTNAQKAGWDSGSTPPQGKPSIIVLMPHVQGAGTYGHVGVVEKVLSTSSVRTSNMDWAYNGGGFDKVSYANFSLGAGVYFIWHR